MSKSTAIRITYAFDPESDSLISIAKAVKGRDYECPECRARLRKRAGEYRREHFFHPKGASCSISYETSLHFGAKLFLKECLTDGSHIEIFFPTKDLPDNEFKALLKKEEIEKIQIPVRRLISVPLCVHKNECTIDGSSYKADVVSKTPQEESVMIWEILVSHGIEQEKRQWLLENCLPFLELKPAEKGFDEFSFEVASFGNLPCLRPETFKLSSLLDVYQEELQGPIAARVLKYFFENIEDLVFNQLVANMENAPLGMNSRLPCHVEDVYHFFQEHEYFEIRPDYCKGPEPEEVFYVPLKEICLVESKYDPSPKFNNKFYANSNLALCGETFIQFSERFAGVMSRVDSNRKLISLRTSVFLKDFTQSLIEVEDDDVGAKEAFERFEMENLQFLKLDRTNPKDPHYRIQLPDEEQEMNSENQPRFDFPANLFVKFLQDLKTIAKIELIVGRNTQTDWDNVYGLKISGIYSIKAFNLHMRGAVIESLKQIFFNPPPKKHNDLSVLERES